MDLAAGLGRRDGGAAQGAERRGSARAYPAGAPSTRSQFYNLKQEGAGLGGHLRPDQLGAIYAVDLAGAQGQLRGITFVDLAGDSMFGVYVPEGADKNPALVAACRRTSAFVPLPPRA